MPKFSDLACIGAPLIVLTLAGMIVFTLFVGKAGGGDLGGGGGTGGSGNSGDVTNANALSCEQIKDLLENKTGDQGKNLAPYYQDICDSATRYSINPLLSIAMAKHDSGMGTAGAGQACRNPGNIKNRDYPADVKYKGDCPRKNSAGVIIHWSGFDDFGGGMQGMHYLLNQYVEGGVNTVDSIINKWAPPSDNNDTPGYIADVKANMTKWAAFYN